VAESSDLTPVEWLARLAPRVIHPDHTLSLDKWRRYYNGDHDLPSGPTQISEAFQAFQRKARTNLCGLAVNSMADRMEIIGYRDESGANDQMWALWVDARMPGRQFSVWRRALSEGAAFVVVGPDPRDSRRPRITIEGADRIAVETDPGDPLRRLAAVRVWHDPLAKRWFGTVYLPRQRHYFQSVRETSSAHLAGDPAAGSSLATMNVDAWEERAPAERSSAGIPVVPFLNADEGRPPLPEFAGEGVDIQDRLNLSVLNRLTVERFQAYRQRALLNFVPDEDPVTGLPLAPFKPGADQVWTVAPARAGEPEPKLVDLATATTADILQAIQGDMRAFAAATSTPVYYLPGGDMVNLSADAIGALDAGHNAKVKNRSALWSDPMAEVWGLMADIAGISAGTVAPEAIAWAPPSAFHPAVTADYVVKMVGAGVPLPMVCEEIGWAPTRIETLRTEMRRAQLQAQTAAALAATATAAGTAATAPTRARPAAPAGARA
jgi:hypothetical protein